jgi:DNA-binding transcriptional regulator YiaG
MKDIDIRALRLKLKESQAKFATRFGVGQSTVARWERDGLPENGTARILAQSLATELGQVAV